VPSGVAKERHTDGQVTDADALLKIHSYCIDTSRMSAREAADVKDFIAKESGPKKVLGKIPWTLMDDCSKADAVVALDFQPTAIMDEQNAAGALQAGTDTSNPAGGGAAALAENQSAWNTALAVVVRGTNNVLYRVTGEAVPRHRENSIKSPFATLGSDLKKLSR
jgi:hypothetical protein